MPTIIPQSFRFSNPAVSVALRPRFNFAQARADRERALVYQTEANRLLKERLVAKQQREAEISQNFQMIASLGLLTPDEQRAKVYNESMLADLDSRIRDGYGGNALKFLEVEGQQWVNNFKTGLVNDPAIQRGIANKTNKGLADADNGKEYRPVTWKRNDGTVLTGRYEDNLADFLSGETDQLNYSGAFVIDTKGMKQFANTNEDPTGLNRPYMDEQDVIAWAVSNGVAAEDAKIWVDRYYNTTKEGLQWDNYSVKVTEAKLETERRKNELRQMEERGRNARARMRTERPAQEQINVLVPRAPIGMVGTMQLGKADFGRIPGFGGLTLPTEQQGAFSFQAHQTSKQAQDYLMALFGVDNIVRKQTEATARDENGRAINTQTRTVSEYVFQPQPGMVGYIYDPQSGTGGSADLSEAYPEGVSVQPPNIFSGTVTAPDGQLIPGAYAQFKTPGGRYFFVEYDPFTAQSAAIQKPVRAAGAPGINQELIQESDEELANQLLED